MLLELLDRLLLEECDEADEEEDEDDEDDEEDDELEDDEDDDDLLRLRFLFLFSRPGGGGEHIILQRLNQGQDCSF